MSIKTLGAFGKKIAQLAYKLGENNNPLNAVLAIALFKGINRPLFTMMDKDSSPEAKKYAAFREGLTEVIAATTYVATNKLLVPPLTKVLHKAVKGSSHTKIERALEFLCVCLSAVLLIPAACNLVLDPVMKGVKKAQDKSKKSFGKKPKLDIKETEVAEIKPNALPAYRPTIKGPNSMLTELQNKYISKVGTNMKVGV